MLLKTEKHQPPPTGEGGKAIASSKGIKVFLRRFFLKKSGRGVKGARSPLVAVRRRRNTLAPSFWRAGKRGEKCDSISRVIPRSAGKCPEGTKGTAPWASGQDRFPLVAAMQSVSLANVPVERLQRIGISKPLSLAFGKPALLKRRACFICSIKQGLTENFYCFNNSDSVS